MLAAEEDPEGIELILPAVDELVWGTITFVVVAWVLMRVALPKIREAIEARERAIQEAKEGADRGRAEAQKVLEEYKEQLAEARSEANKILEEARQSAEQVRKDLIAKAEHDAQQVIERAQGQIEAERTRTLDEVRAQVRDLAVVVAEKVVGESLDRKTQTKLVDQYIEQVGSMNGGSNN
jgi:F-type H+-transporting ATPase subunit b